MTSEERPQTEGDVAAMVRAACADGAKLDIVGGGALAGYGRPAAAERTLSTAALKGIVFYAPAEMTISVRAGTPVEEVEAAIGEAGQMLPFEPMRPGVLWDSNAAPTVGGMAATNLSGPRRPSAGAVRDGVLGLKLVNGLGQTIRCGGRVTKNVTGLDLTRLNCGAHGTLGVLTEVTMKLLPRPETETTLVVAGLDATQAVGAMTAALNAPCGVTGAAWLQPGMGEADSRTCLRLEGFADSVAYRIGKLRPALHGFGEIGALEADASRALWRQIRDAEFLADPRERAVWRVSLPPSEAPAYALRLGATARALTFDWGGGLVWAATDETDAAAAKVRAALPARGGHATLMRASAAFRARAAVFQPPSDLELRLARGIKASFDPGFVLNFGRMYRGV